LSQNDPAISAIKRSIILRLKTICEESLNSDGQHFNQYQQNEQSPLTSKSLNTEKPQDMLMEI
jgi:hypothetical protein